ncbi:MAG: ATP-binding protein [Gammaproteobacteria bacterium]
MRLSLANRLIVALVVGGGVILAGLFVALDIAVDRALYSRFDDALVARGRVLAGLIDARAQAAVSDAARWPEYAAGGHQEFFQLWDAGGATLARSASSGGRDLARPPISPGAAPVLYDLALPDGHRGRAVALQVHGGPRPDAAPGPRTLVVATEREALEALEARLHFALVLGTLVALPLLALLGILAVRRGLAPLASFSDAVAARVVTRAGAAAGAGERGVEADPASLPAELRPIAATVNAAVDTALAALAREQRFAREAAHELRTPLAEMRVLTHERTAADADARALRRAVDTMSRSVDALLALARCEAGLDTPAIEPVELVELIEQQWRLLASDARLRDLVYQCSAPAEVWVMSDGAMLERIFANLLGNAVHHAPAAALIDVHVVEKDGRVHVEVANTAPGLDVAALATALADGQRASAASGYARPHAGLGLLLCHALARQLDLALDVVARGDGIVVRLAGLQSLDVTG